MKPEGICPSSGKVGYANEAGAELVLSYLQSQGRDECRTYQCPRCNLWHLTRRPCWVEGRAHAPSKPSILWRLRERLSWVTV